MEEMNKDNVLEHHGILGMKWGVRRYQNKDGSLTDVGKKRYARDISNNASKKKENRIDTSKPNPSRWVKEDLERSKRALDASSDLVKQLKGVEKSTRPKANKVKMDLSNMTNKEMQDQINRELLERKYNELFGKEETSAVSRGRKCVIDTLETAGTVLAVGSSSLAIALAIKELKG